MASSGGGTAITGSGTITSATQQVTGINVSSLPDGTLTYSVYLTDAAGNAGTPVTATATLDKTPPAGYSIAADQDPINAATATAASFTFDNAEISAGTTYNYTVTSDNGGNARFGLRHDHFGDAADHEHRRFRAARRHLTYSVYLTDAAGNVGGLVTPTATLDTTAPAGYSISVDQKTIDASTASAVSFTFAGAEVGTTYSYTVTSSGGGTPVIGTGPVTRPRSRSPASTFRRCRPALLRSP